MKNFKYILFLLMIVSCIILTGCSSSKVDYTLEELKQYTIDSVHAYEKDGVYYVNVANDVKLPTKVENVDGTKITWTSYDEGCITSDGKILDRDSRKILNIDFSCEMEVNGEKEYLDFVFRLTTISLETAAQRFEGQLPNLIFEDRTFTTVYDSLINVSWTSSNEEVFSNEGVYTKPVNDTDTIINYIVSDSNSKVEMSKTIKVQGKTIMDFYEDAEKWVKLNVIPDMYLTDNITLPTSYEGKVNLIWTSLDESIISNDGTIHQSYYDKYVYLKCKIEIGDHSSVFKVQLKVAAKSTDGVSDEELLQDVIKDITKTTVAKRVFPCYANINQYYNFLPFYVSDKATVTEAILSPTRPIRPGTIKTSTEYITVHDTANNAATADAKMHSSYLNTTDNEVSWNYTTDENGSYHHIPNNEVSWHAGDGSRVFGTIDTGIKATAVMPHITMEDGFYCINGEKTKIRPMNTDGTYVTKDYKTEDINHLGIFCEIGENGNYFLGKTYFSTSFGYISNYGGNRNSIGIESCVNSGSDYGTTFRELAKLVAELLIENNIGVDRVKGHHYFSGKACPNSILTAEYWCDFLTLVSLEKFCKTKLASYDFNWTSLSSNMDNRGRISLSVNKGDTVNYKVVVNKSGSKVYEQTFTTTIK